jgi:methionine synthase I (cobalamin-dependent)
MVPLYSQFTNMTQEQQATMRNNFRTMSQRAAEMAERAAQEQARQQEEARVRGDVAEVNRLEGVLRAHRERMERMRQRPELAPEAQAGPPLE